jgi:short-subunit dehydrogenase
MRLPEELQFIANARMIQKTTTARMDGKMCIITGATSGVGYQAAKRLAQGGAHLVLVCRNQQKAEQVQGELELTYNTQIDVLLADFSCLNEVRQVAGRILENYPHIDVLINNAGLHNTPSQIDCRRF